LPGTTAAGARDPAIGDQLSVGIPGTMTVASIFSTFLTTIFIEPSSRAFFICRMEPDKPGYGLSEARVANRANVGLSCR
jgi:hypothetical protein